MEDMLVPVKCPFCSDMRIIPVARQDITEHLVVTMDENSHFHIHGPIKEKELMKKMILNIAREAQIDIEDEGGQRIKGGITREQGAKYHDKETRDSSEGCKIYEE